MKPAAGHDDYSQALDRVLKAWEKRQPDAPRQDRLIQLAARRQMTVQELQQVLERIDRGYRMLHARQAPTRSEIVDLALEHINSH
jgi:Lhr-like helicase